MLYSRMIGHYTLLAGLITSVYCSPSEEGSGWVFEAAAAAAADPAPLTSDSAAAAAAADLSPLTSDSAAAAATDPTVIVKTRDVTKCITSRVCTGDHECGERGSCLGFLSVPGTCNCAACVNLWTCRDDRDCGGLKGACDVTYGTCRCMQALERNGFRLLKATSSFCSVKKCRDDHREDDCLGLPCHTGRCYCRYSWIDE